MTNKLKDAREFLAKQTAEISAAYGREVMGSVASGAARLTLGRNLALLPLLVLGILKTVSCFARDMLTGDNMTLIEFNFFSRKPLTKHPSFPWIFVHQAPSF